MKKTIFKAAAVLCMLFIAVSCTQYRIVPIFPPEDDSTPYDVSTPEDFVTMLTSTGRARLTADVAIETLDSVIASGEAAVSRLIDLDGHTLTVSDDSEISGDGTIVTMSNGTLDLERGFTTSEESAYANLTVSDGSTLTLTDMDIHSGSTGIYVKDFGTTLNITDSTIIADGAYGVSTNAGTSGQSVDININNSTIIADVVGICKNIPGTLTITDSEIQSGHVAMLIRSGEAVVEDSIIHSIGSFDIDADWKYCFDANNWGTGNQVAYAALTVGNAKNTAYNSTTSVALINTTVTMDRNNGVNDKAATIFLASMDGMTATLISDKPEHINGIKANTDRYLWIGPNCYIQNYGETSSDHLTATL